LAENGKKRGGTSNRAKATGQKRGEVTGGEAGKRAEGGVGIADPAL